VVTKELVSVYICSDGKKFLEKEDADEYEEGLNSIIDHYKLLGDFKNISG
jgi:hypothetical protein